MNSIIIKKNKIIKFIEDSIIVNYTKSSSEFEISLLEIDVLGDTSLKLDYIDNEKIDVRINLNDNTKLELYETRKSSYSKIQYKYYLEDNTELNLNKFYDIEKLKELNVIYLEGVNSKINYNFSSIAKDKTEINIITYHSAKSDSFIKNRVINCLNGTTTIKTTDIVYSGIKNCKVRQDDKIINLNDNNCIIEPKLIIDEDDTDAKAVSEIKKDKNLYKFIYVDIKDDKRIKKSLEVIK